MQPRNENAFNVRQSVEAAEADALVLQPRGMILKQIAFKRIYQSMKTRLIIDAKSVEPER